MGGENLYQFAPNTQVWGNWLGLAGVDMNLSQVIKTYTLKLKKLPMNRILSKQKGMAILR